MESKIQNKTKPKKPPKTNKQTNTKMPSVTTGVPGHLFKNAI